MIADRKNLSAIFIGGNMRRTNKHTVNRITFSGLTGGINISQAPEQISDTEMQEAQNFIYEKDSKRLTGRGGLGKLYSLTESIRDMYYDVDTNIMLLFTGQYHVYRYVTGQEPTLVGTLNGSSLPSCAKFMDKIWIASGGKLQYYDYSDTGTLTTVDSSPTCNLVFQRFSRIAVSMNGTDGFYLSSVGDGTEWTEDTNMKSKKQWLDVGYGDSGDIVAIVPLATDIVFIKSNGKIYQLSGDADPDDWQLTEIANNTDPANNDCAVNIGNSVIFLSLRGLRTLSAVMEYGNIATSDIGDKFNGLITSGMYEPRIFHLKRHSMLLIRPSDDYTYFVAYNYLLGSATTLRFSVPITSVCETTNNIIVSSNDDMFSWSEEYTDDNGAAINYLIKPKSTISTEDMILKSVDTKLSADHAGTAKITDGTLSVSIPTERRNKFKCNHTTDCIDLSITSTNRFTVDHIILEVADL